MNILMKTLRSLLQKCINDIDNGSCNLDDAELAEAITSLQKYSRKDTPMSKYQAYTYLNMSRASFDNHIRDNKLPRGKKIPGFTELVWFQKDLDKYIKNGRESNQSR